MDSTDALELPEFSGGLLVIGGGIIGLEMACVYDALGSRVSVVELTPSLMPGTDPDLVRPLEKRIKGRYEQILTGTKVARVEPLLEGLRVTFEGDKAPPEPQIYDRILVAVGRVPNGKTVGAENAGVTVTDRGYIPVDKQMRTNLPHIFAIGDIAGPPMLAHKAMHEAKVAAEVAAGQKSAFDARVIPSVAYTDPEIAWVGLTETEAKAKNIPYKKGTFPWLANGRSLSLGREEGLTKMLFDPETHRVLGGGIVGTNAGDLISEIALAIETGCDAADIGLTIHPHPTLSETIAGAADAFEGTLTDLFIPKRGCACGRRGRRQRARAAGLGHRHRCLAPSRPSARYTLLLRLLRHEPLRNLDHLRHPASGLTGNPVLAVHNQTRRAVYVVGDDQCVVAAHLCIHRE
jgi:dihydrolipoamide dehydrogenase